jgi:hypothetical protein
MKWITRKNIRVDRAACPWLIKRFVDPTAQFLFVQEKDLLEQAKLQDAIRLEARKIAVGTVVPSQANIRACCLSVGRIDL